MPLSSTDATADFLRRHAPFDRMAAAHLDFLVKRLSLSFYAKGAVITGPDEGPAERLYIIKQGGVRGESGEGGEEGAWELEPGEAFPIGALLAHRPPRMVIRATEECFCLELSRDDFDQLRSLSPLFQDFCTRRMANLLDKALRGIQARSAGRVAEGSTLDAPLAELVRRRPVSCGGDTPLRRVLERLHEERIGSVAVTDGEGRPVGLFTLRDAVGRVALPGVALERPVSEVGLEAPLTLPPEAPAHEAALLMTRFGADHLCLVDGGGRLVGVLSERDLFSLQRLGLVSLGRAIAGAEDVATLARLERDVHRLIDQMLAQGASVEQLSRLITELNDRLTRRVIELAIEETGDPGVPFVWLAFGSEGRIEQTLKTDQDNGILFEVRQGEGAEAARQRLLPLARRINEMLAECGFPLCPGNIMAGNPECCLSLKEWQDRFARWIDLGTPEHLLKATIFFDFRPLHGDPAPAVWLRRWLAERTAANSRFRHQLAANAMQHRPPLGLFGEIKVSHGGEHPHTVDLKAHGVTPFVDAARIFALAHGVTGTHTVERLRKTVEAGALNANDAEAWIEAYHYLQLRRMRHHRRQAERGEPLSNHFDPAGLNDLERRILKEAFRQARKLQSKLALEYQL